MNDFRWKACFHNKYSKNIFLTVAINFNTDYNVTPVFGFSCFQLIKQDYRFGKDFIIT